MVVVLRRGGARGRTARCSSNEGTERVRLARDCYTYLHFPMVAGIIYLALGLKKVAEYVADTEHHALTDPLRTTAAGPSSAASRCT